MKKSLLLATSLMPLILISCSSNSTNNNSSFMKSTCVPLTMENYQTYLNVVIYNPNGFFRTDHTITFSTVLSFALYENVKVDLNLHIYGANGGYSYSDMDTDVSHTITLNAAGCGVSTLYNSNKTIDNVVDSGITSDLGYYTITWSVKNISGNVKYNIW